MTSKLADLKKLIPAKLKPINSLERELLEGCVEGNIISGKSKEISKSEQKTNFIRGDFLSWLLGDKDANKFIHYTGVHLEGLLIDGQLLLEGAVLEFPLRMKNCSFNTQINLNGAKVVILDLSSSQLEDGLTANFLKTQASIFLEKNFRSNNGISLRGAEIFGNLNCEDAYFSSKKSDLQYTFDATLSNIRGNVSFQRSKHSNGAAYFEDVNIRGVFDCDSASFENYSAINRDFEPFSLSLERAKIGGSVLLRNKFNAVGTVRLHEATIGGALECDGSNFTAAKDSAILADGLSTIGPVFMRNKFKAVGRVSMYGARIGNTLDCSDASFENENSNSLLLGEARIEGNVRLCQKFNSIGTVSLQGATIGGSLDCGDGTFKAKEGQDAIIADGVVTGDFVLMRNKFKAIGCVNLYGAKIGNGFDCSGATFENRRNEFCFIGDEMRVNGEFKWNKWDNTPLHTTGVVSFRNVTVRSFLTDMESCPASGSLKIDGFVYDSLDFESKDGGNNAKTKVNNLRYWLGLRPDYQKSLQPYTQLIKTLSSTGHGAEAREIAIERERRRSGHMPRLRRILRDSTLGLFVDYGYKPWKALYFILFFVIVGAWLFGVAKTEHIMVHAKNDLSVGYPQFVPLAYSIDVFLPIVDLHQEEYWMPSIEAIPNSWDGVFVMNYMWFHIAIGWVLTTIFVSAITGIIRTSDS